MSYYQESQERIAEAEQALRAGDDTRARALYREAAGLQRAFIDSVPRERTRTRSIYGLSVAALLHRAGDLDAAERFAQQLLAEPWVEEHSADGLRQLLDTIRNDRRTQATQAPSALHAGGNEGGNADQDDAVAYYSDLPPQLRADLTKRSLFSDNPALRYAYKVAGVTALGLVLAGVVYAVTK